MWRKKDLSEITLENIRYSDKIRSLPLFFLLVKI